MGYWSSVDWAYTDASGRYAAGPLATGMYRVGFRPPFGEEYEEYLEEYYNNAFTLDSAANVSVTNGVVTNNINAGLARQRHFTHIGQPRFAAPGQMLTFNLDFQIPDQGQPLTPRLGIRLPPGWSVISLAGFGYSGDNTGNFNYNSTLTADLNASYDGTWWAAAGQAATWSDATTTVAVTVQAPNTPGDYRLGLLIGDSNAWGRLEEAPIHLTSQQPVRGGSVTAVRDQSGSLFDAAATSTSLQTAVGLNMGVVYHYLGWNQLEPRPGQYNWAMLDDILAQVDAYNLKVVLRLYNPPEWYSGVGSLAAALAQEDHYVRIFSQTEIRDLMEALTAHVRRNGQSDRVAGYVVWNEPNIAEQWDNQPPNAAAYMAMLQAAYEGAKAGDPAAKIISAPLAPTATQTGVAINDLAYLGQMYDYGLQNYTDYVGLNGLGFQYEPDYDPGNPAYSFTRLKYLHNIMVNRGDSSRKVWALEVGWLRNSSYDLGSFNAYKVSDAQQQQYTTRAFAKAATEWPWLELMSVWNLDFDRYYPPTSNFYWYTYKAAAGDITGKITGPDGVTPLAGAWVWAYQLREGWWAAAGSAQSDAAGNYQLTLPGGEYRLYISAGGNQYLPEYYQNAATLDVATPISVTAGAATANINASLAQVTPPLIGVSGSGWQWPDPANGQVAIGAPWGGGQVTISYHAACSSGTVTLQLGSNSWPMTPQGGGLYQATLNLPGDMPAGNSMAEMSVTADCGGGPTGQPVGYLYLYDPSGQVLDEASQPIAGAQVNLYRVEGAQPDEGGQKYDCRTVESRSGGDWSGEPATTLDAGSWVNPEVVALNGQAEISPTVNPQTTGADGRYGWDVAAGCWYVVVDANGYDQAVSPLVGVPPAVTDLDLMLSAAAKGDKVYLPTIVKE